MAEPVEMWFGIRTSMVARNHLLDGSLDALWAVSGIMS